MKKVAIYPGTFDPVTIGHLDIIKRVAKLYDELRVVILVHPNKKTLFSTKEREELLFQSTLNMPNVIVESSSMLAVDYAKSVHANVLIRGLRAATDFEYELQIAAANQYLDDSIEMFFLMTRPEHSFISSSNVKEMAFYKRSVKGLVPEIVEEALKKKYES